MVAVVLLILAVVAVLSGDAADLRGDTKPGINIKVQELKSLLPELIKLPKNSTKKPDKKSEAFVEALTQCLPTIQLCPLTVYPPSTCALHCILDGSNTTRNLVFLFRNVARQLCQATGTLFDLGFQVLLDEGAVRVRRLSSYLLAQGADPHTFPQFSHIPMAIPMALIKYGNSPIFNALKPSVLAIQASFQASFSFLTPQLSNPLCQRADLTSPVMLLAETLTLNPHVADIILPGFFTLSTMATLRMDALLEPIAALFKTMVLLGGAECSMVLYSQTGKRIKNCSEVMGPRYARYFEPRPTKTEVCSEPINSELIDLSKFFPNIKMEEPEKLFEEEALAHTVTNYLFYDKTTQDMDAKVIKDKLTKKDKKT